MSLPISKLALELQNSTGIPVYKEYFYFLKAFCFVKG